MANIHFIPKTHKSIILLINKDNKTITDLTSLKLSNILIQLKHKNKITTTIKIKKMNNLFLNHNKSLMNKILSTV
jgi:hypothetical protein